MYLFSRQVQLTGDPRKSLAAASEMTALVNRKSELQFSLWLAEFGAPVGSVSFSALVQSRAELDAQTSALLDDEEYLAKIADIQQFSAGQPVDSLIDVMHVAGNDYKRAEVGAIAEITAAVIKPGKYAAAIQWSVEVADLVSEISGLPVMFGPTVGGTFGQVEWIGTSSDTAAAEAIDQQLNKDPRYLTKLDETGGLFVDGSGLRIYAKRIA